MASCRECESELILEKNEVTEGDIIECDECGAEFEVVGTEPLELARAHTDLDEDDELFEEDEE